MRLIKTTTYSIFLIILSVLSSCGTSDISDVSNKMPIEIRTIGTIEEEDAKRELGVLLKGVRLADKFFVPIIDVTDITYNIDSTKLIKAQIKIPLSSIDAYSLGFTDDVLDQSTYEDNLEDANLEKDSAYIMGIKILTAVRGNTIKSGYLPADPIKSNEFFIGNSSSTKTDTTKHIFSSSEDLLNYLRNSKRNDTRLILFFMGGKSPSALKDDDKDGVTNDLDQCPDVKGSISCNGCECPSNDSDGDGILNDNDGCPDKKGPKENNGCPWPDSDNDGTPDKLDNCPDEVGKCNGCPCPSNDRDSDGVLNSNDKCPDEKGPASNGGCPLKPEVSHDNNEGKFYFKNVDFQKQTVEITIKLMDGSSKIVYPQKSSFPSTGEYDNLTKELTQAAGITVTVKVTDKGTKALVIPQLTLSNLSLVCLKPEPGSPKKCGFMNTDL
jgi:hypothetical protein